MHTADIVVHGNARRHVCRTCGARRYVDSGLDTGWAIAVRCEWLPWPDCAANAERVGTPHWPSTIQ